MKTDITIGNIKIELERFENDVGVDIFYDMFLDEDSRDYMNLIGTVCEYLFNEGFLTEKDIISFDVKHPA